MSVIQKIPCSYVGCYMFKYDVLEYQIHLRSGLQLEHGDHLEGGAHRAIQLTIYQSAAKALFRIISSKELVKKFRLFVGSILVSL